MSGASSAVASQDGPELGFLVPVFNRRQLLAQTIDSIVDAAAGHDFEIVIADNASDDGTWEVAQELAVRHAQVRCHRNAENVGPVRNWLRCSELSTARYVKLHFSDDLLLPCDLSSVLAPLADAEHAFVVTSVLIGPSPDRSIVAYGRSSASIGAARYRADALYGGVPVSPCAAFFRRQDLTQALDTIVHLPEAADWLSTGAGADALVYLLVAEKYPKVAFSSERSTFFRIHEGSITIRDGAPRLAKLYCAASIWYFGLHGSRWGHGESYAAQMLSCARTRGGRADLASYLDRIRIPVPSVGWKVLGFAVAFVKKLRRRLRWPPGTPRGAPG